MKGPSLNSFQLFLFSLCTPISGEASSDELVMQNSLRMRKHDPACAMLSRSKSMTYEPIFTSYGNASISDYYILLRNSVEVKQQLPRQIRSQ